MEARNDGNLFVIYNYNRCPCNQTPSQPFNQILRYIITLALFIRTMALLMCVNTASFRNGDNYKICNVFPVYIYD